MSVFTESTRTILQGATMSLAYMNQLSIGSALTAALQHAASKIDPSIHIHSDTNQTNICVDFGNGNQGYFPIDDHLNGELGKFQLMHLRIAISA